MTVLYSRSPLPFSETGEDCLVECGFSMSLAQLLDKESKRDEARTMLAEIYGWFTEGFDTADLRDAKALLDQLSA